MVIAIRFLALFIVVFGIIFILKPVLLHQIITFFLHTLYLAGILKICCGILFLLTAMQCRVPSVMIILGISSIVSGIAAFIIDGDKLRSMVASLYGDKTIIYRIHAGIAIALGIVLLYCA